MISSNLVGSLRRSLLIKVISKPTPSRADVASVIELAASKIVEALEAQSMTFYLVEGDAISFRQVYYSPSLWADDPEKEQYFRNKAANLLAMKILARHSDTPRPDIIQSTAPCRRAAAPVAEIDWHPGTAGSRDCRAGD